MEISRYPLIKTDFENDCQAASTESSLERSQVSLMHINKPLSVKYLIINISGPELNHDDAPDPIQSILPQVIEATNRVLIGNGDLGRHQSPNDCLNSSQTFFFILQI